MDRLEVEREGGREIKGERTASLPGKAMCVCVCLCMCVCVGVGA